MQGCAALNKKHLVIIGNAHQLAQIRLSLIDDGLENLGAVAHFHNTHTGAMIIKHFGGDFFEDRFR
ncbi:hypothetical protein SDC9_206588 [bioreactor metagenome]|uniref:Uncharacterized protein n=1 Tax=bioreactor metagenome TaxID=1076179 RepID=A0A645J6W9_9ZZZZ